MVEDNHNLIYAFANSRKLSLEEYYGLLAIELCETIKYFDETKGALSTIYYLRCDNLIKGQYRRNNRLKRRSGNILSLDYEYKNDLGERTTMCEIYNFDTGECLEEDAISNTILDDIEDSEYKEIVMMRYDGYTQVEIANRLGISQSKISNTLQKVRREFIDGEETDE